MNINIEHEIERITAQIIKKHGPEKIIFFGSAVIRFPFLLQPFSFSYSQKSVCVHSCESVAELKKIIHTRCALLFRASIFQLS